MSTNPPPQDTDRTLHIFAGSGTLGEQGPNLLNLIERAQEKWPGIRINELSIDSLFHRNINFDRFDPDDYDHYLVVNALNEYFERIKTEDNPAPSAGQT